MKTNKTIWETLPEYKKEAERLIAEIIQDENKIKEKRARLNELIKPNK